ncbi:dipeptide ABC transporter ATP-binding protein DppD [Acidovorax sp. SRB_14]|uniref:ABC transporter ATP-binding protein n=1 Tax=Acidovorax sp. SRB_14 TaxID=1962699 RepID=UPI0015669F8F|nr:ABC transporter ATP-binding protein [Acidovorax sp. SRB_14]NMM81926.1 dipeptide ABC transporter ATP-binding protein DppD [Acidovorax sp. SRB_14]
MALLDIENLHVDFPTQGAVMHAVDGVSLQLQEGEVLGIVGESGSGKSVTMMALMGLIGYPGQVRAQQLQFAGHDLLGLSDRQRRSLVGKDVAMIFQDPTTSLNPCFTIGFQLMEVLRLHLKMDRAAARRRATELLEQVGIPSASARLNDYPHQMSGGMNQRVMIAMAIACNPRLLIADEPTTALDVTIQAQILDLLRQLQQERGMALVLITHNMGVVQEMAQRVAVMYAGQVVEQSTVDALFAAPQHPYTEALLAAMPEQVGADGRLATIPGVVPGLYDRPTGCLFAPRCAYATVRCQALRPELRPVPAGVAGLPDIQVRCHYPLRDATRQVRIEADGPVAVEVAA